jgi:hypothetical protein
MNTADFLKNLANPRSTPHPIRRMVEGGHKSVRKTVANAPKPVDAVTSEHNPATPSGSIHPGPTEMEVFRAEPPVVSRTRPTPGKLSHGALGPRK